jgi:hypothetical protein
MYPRGVRSCYALCIALSFVACKPTLVRDVSQGVAFAETTVAVVPTDPARGLRNYVVGFNAYGGTPGRWAVSTDGGASWTRHS